MPLITRSLFRHFTRHLHKLMRRRRRCMFKTSKELTFKITRWYFKGFWYHNFIKWECAEALCDLLMMLLLMNCLWSGDIINDGLFLLSPVRLMIIIVSMMMAVTVNTVCCDICDILICVGAFCILQNRNDEN